MTIEDETIAQNAAAASARISDIKELFESLKQTLREQVSALPETSPTTPKHMLAKLNELQTAQVLLLKAEEAYYEKYGHDDRQVSIDHDAIRDQVGRQLNRIRDNASAEGIFGSVRTASD